ncbi:hypothetical protein [Lentzea sp.]|uniref:hypothetical protein n=1 Tax=Lentzea sp. TaxID=56099 RepID=UPI002CA32535|nr:hypothetical protein [Lentzea sp.]HUQ60222.1 hypothetical protein [Lentzea sp.]
MTRRNGGQPGRGEAVVLVNGLLAGVGSLYVLTDSVAVTVGAAVLAVVLAALSLFDRPSGS